MERSRCRKEIVQEIIRRNGDVSYDWDNWAARGKGRPRPSLLRTVLGDDFFDGIERVSLVREGIDDKFLARVSQLDELKVLLLCDTAVTDDGLTILSAFTRLDKLWIRSDVITNEGLKHVASLSSIRELSCECDQVNDTGVRYLAGMRELRYLSLAGTRVTDAGLMVLGELSHLETLSLYQTIVTADGVGRLKAALPCCQIYHSPPLDQLDPMEDPFAGSRDRVDQPSESCFGP